MFLNPMKMYLTWLVINSIVNFVIFSKTIKEKGYTTTFTYMSGMASVRKILGKYGLNDYIELVFIVGNFLFWFIFNL